MKSFKFKACAEIDASMAAGLSQQPKLCGGEEERWVEVTLIGDAHAQLQHWLLAIRSDSDGF